MISVPIKEGEPVPETPIDAVVNDAIVETDDNLDSLLNPDESEATNTESDADGTELDGNNAHRDEEIQLPNNDFCFTPADFIETRNESSAATRHASVYNSAWNRIKQLVGQTVESKSSKGNVVWTIVDAVEDDVFKLRRGVELQRFKEKFCPVIDEERVFHDSEDLSKAFWKLWPANIDSEVEKVNKLIDKTNRDNKETYKRQFKQISKSEFVIFHALLIAASIFAEKGDKLWEEERPKKRRGISKSVNFGRWMKAWRFRQLKLFIPRLMECEEMKAAGDDWWRFKKRVNDFNANRVNNLYASHALVFDESMSAYTPR